MVPVNSSATSKSYYYPVEGKEKIAPGIYKGTINGKGKAVLTEKIYKEKDLSKHPIKMDKSFYYHFYGKENVVAKKTDFINDPYSLITKPFYHVETDGKNLYFSKYLYRVYYRGLSCGGNFVYILEIYKRDNKGKIYKVVKDKVTSRTVNSFVIKNNYIYYAKLNNNLTKNYDIVRSTLDGKKKMILKKSVSDFWVNGNYIYYVSNKTLYRMNFKGKNIKKYSNIKLRKFDEGECFLGDYEVTKNGILVKQNTGKQPVLKYFDFSTGKAIKLPNTSLEILDVDVEKKRLLALKWETNYKSVGIFKFDEKPIKKKKAQFKYVEGYSEIYSVDAKKGEVIYYDGTKLKKVSI